MPGAASRVVKVSTSTSSERPCTAVRGTLILASLQALRQRQHYERYLALLDPRARAEITALRAPAWVPVALAETHYAACEALGLSTAEKIAIGTDVSRVDALGVHMLIGLARAGGVDMWSILDRLPSSWNRMYQGSFIHVEKVGPKDARIFVTANSLARFDYWRVGLRGVGEGLFRRFCSRVYARELTAQRTADSAWFTVVLA